MNDCIFCKIITGDLPSYKLYEDDQVLVFLDINPVNPGHSLIVPKNHSEKCLDDTEEDLVAVMKTMKKVSPAILKTVGAEAMNFTTNCGRAAGQVVFHTHFHIIPRLATDGHENWKPMEGPHEDLGAMAEKIRSEI